MSALKLFRVTQIEERSCYVMAETPAGAIRHADFTDIDVQGEKTWVDQAKWDSIKYAEVWDPETQTYLDADGVKAAMER